MPWRTGNGSLAVLILTLEVPSCFTNVSPWGKCWRYPLDKWPVGFGEEKNLLALRGIELQLHSHPACSVVTIPTGYCGCQALSCIFSNTEEGKWCSLGSVLHSAYDQRAHCRFHLNHRHIPCIAYIKQHCLQLLDLMQTVSRLVIYHIDTDFSFLLTYSMEQSPSWEANWFCS